jgi:hypothetical protein
MSEMPMKNEPGQLFSKNRLFLLTPTEQESGASPFIFDVSLKEVDNKTYLQYNDGLRLHTREIMEIDAHGDDIMIVLGNGQHLLKPFSVEGLGDESRLLVEQMLGKPITEFSQDTLSKSIIDKIDETSL